MTGQEARHDLTRLSVNLNRETADTLKALAESRGLSLTEVVRRAISVAHFIQGELDAGRQIHTVRADGKKRRELIFK